MHRPPLSPLLIGLCLAVLAPHAAPAETPDRDAFSAFDDGYSRGVAPPLIGWGSAHTAAGIATVALGSAFADGDEDIGAFVALQIVGGITTGLGVAELATGIALLVTHPNPAPTDPMRTAFDGGYNKGWGAAMIGYGAVYGASALGNLAAVGDDVAVSSYLPSLLVGLAISGLHLGFGIDSYLDGKAVGASLIATTVPTPLPSPTPGPGEPALPTAWVLPILGGAF